MRVKGLGSQSRKRVDFSKAELCTSVYLNKRQLGIKYLVSVSEGKVKLAIFLHVLPGAQFMLCHLLKLNFLHFQAWKKIDNSTKFQAEEFFGCCGFESNNRNATNFDG